MRLISQMLMKNMYKEVIKDDIWNHHYFDMKKELESSKKLKDLKDDDFSEVQDYFKVKSVDATRRAFKVRSQMLGEIPANFRNKYEKKEGGLKCSYCCEDKICSQSHCLECTAWMKEREGLDLTNIMDLVMFFKRVLDERDRMDKDVEVTALHDSC